MVMEDRRGWSVKDNDVSLEVPPCGGERNVARREPDGASRMKVVATVCNGMVIIAV
jgi:hypothetical protein